MNSAQLRKKCYTDHLRNEAFSNCNALGYLGDSEAMFGNEESMALDYAPVTMTVSMNNDSRYWANRPVAKKGTIENPIILDER